MSAKLKADPSRHSELRSVADVSALLQLVCTADERVVLGREGEGGLVLFNSCSRQTV